MAAADSSPLLKENADEQQLAMLSQQARRQLDAAEEKKRSFPHENVRQTGTQHGVLNTELRRHTLGLCICGFTTMCDVSYDQRFNLEWAVRWGCLDRGGGR